MIVNVLQFEKYNQTALEHKITFTSDRHNQIDPVFANIKSGTQYVVVMIEAESKEAQSFVDETPEETKERFRKHMNSLVNSVGEKLGKTPDVFRLEFKDELKKMGIIKDTTLELDIAGYAKVIALLKQK